MKRKMGPGYFFLGRISIYTRSIFPGKSLSLCRPFSKSFQGGGWVRWCSRKLGNFHERLKVLSSKKVNSQNELESTMYMQTSAFFFYIILCMHVLKITSFSNHKKTSCKKCNIDCRSKLNS